MYVSLALRIGKSHRDMFIKIGQKINENMYCKIYLPVLRAAKRAVEIRHLTVNVVVQLING